MTDDFTPEERERMKAKDAFDPSRPLPLAALGALDFVNRLERERDMLARLWDGGFRCIEQLERELVEARGQLERLREAAQAMLDAPPREGWEVFFAAYDEVARVLAESGGDPE